MDAYDGGTDDDRHESGAPASPAAPDTPGPDVSRVPEVSPDPETSPVPEDPAVPEDPVASEDPVVSGTSPASSVSADAPGEPWPVVHGPARGPGNTGAGAGVGGPSRSPEPPPPPPPPTDITTLSPRHQIGVALALAVVAIAVCVHLGMSFLHVAPSNTVTKQHGQAIDDWIYPEFEQNWKLFAPNPLQQNIAVQVRAELRTGDGGTRTTGWYDLSAQDGRAIDRNPLPSHTQQNELRRAWDFFTATHGADNRPVGMRGALSESYLRRIVMLRLDRADVAGPGGTVDRIQVRSRTTNVPPPDWSRERVSDKAAYRVLPWWPVSESDTDVRAAAAIEGSVR